MATLVLTALGTAIGGPIGGAIGAIIGQQADAAIFAPKARQGPRLSDLKFQTSSYGDAIPQIFGTLRVAGTVIWATDLIERRQKRSAGKGQPKVVEYSYSASLAVALSSRPIRSVKRIWADGRILRDGTGKLAEQVVLRVHDGSPDQAADPLIASSVGMARASAFRGIAHVVLEELDLTAFGNRIPQLSFEVEADAGAVGVAEVAGALAARAVEADPALQLTGYAASGARVRDALAPLAELGQLGLRRSASGWMLAGADAVVSTPVDAALARVHSAAAPEVAEERRTALARVAEAVSVRHYDPARDYQTSLQTAPVAGGAARPVTLELPGALAAGAAKAAAQRLALVAGDMRRTAQVQAGLGALALPLGAVFTLALAGEGSARWRIAERVVANGGVRLTLVQHAPPVAVGAAAGDGGAAQLPGDLPGGTTTLAIFDVPGDGEAVRAIPLRLIAAAGSDARWRGADLWWKSNALAEPEALGRVGGALALGTLALPLAATRGWLIDEGAAAEVVLTNEAMALVSIGMAQLLAGGNRAMIGSEVIQFGRAVPLGGTRWRLTGLLRGRAGTEDLAGPHEVGAPFVLLDDPALMALPDAMALRAVDAGAVIERQERGDPAMVPHPIAVGSRAMRPLSPVHGRCEQRAGGGLRLTWVPRSRAGARWRDGVDAPPGESRLHWRIVWPENAGSNSVRELDLPELDLASGTFVPGGTASVVQIGDHGISPPLNIHMA